MIEVAIDSSKGSSIALAKNGEIVAYVDELDFGRDSDSQFLPFLQSFLAENSLTLNDVEGWTVGLGPGSFAGIRFALALVKGICTVSKAKSRGVPSAFAMASEYGHTGRVGVVQDARCGKLYVSIFDCGEKCVPAGDATMQDATAPLPKCDAYCTPDTLDYDKIGTPKARFLVASTIPWQDKPDFEPTYVRAAAGN